MDSTSPVISPSPFSGSLLLRYPVTCTFYHYSANLLFPLFLFISFDLIPLAHLLWENGIQLTGSLIFPNKSLPTHMLLSPASTAHSDIHGFLQHQSSICVLILPLSIISKASLLQSSSSFLDDSLQWACKHPSESPIQEIKTKTFLISSFRYHHIGMMS